MRSSNNALIPHFFLFHCSLMYINHLIFQLIESMSSNIEKMVKKIILIGDNSRLIEEILNDEIVEFEHFLAFIFSNVEQIQDVAKLNILAKIMARELFKTKKLTCVNNEINHFNEIQPSASKKTL